MSRLLGGFLEQAQQRDDIARMFRSLNNSTSNRELFSEIVNSNDVLDLHIAGLTLSPDLSLYRIDGRRGYGRKSFEIILLDNDEERVLHYLFVTPSYRVIFEGRNVMQAFSWRTLLPGNEEIIGHVCNRLFDDCLLNQHRVVVTAINAELEGTTFWTKRIMSSLKAGHPAYAYDLTTSESFCIQDEHSVMQEWVPWLWQDKDKAGGRIALLG
ncbi:hypothetical protein NGC38_14905 [Kluyvera cryocrescens]|uniref:hypothetical protein n=1 Tax=Kluyvera cryocrescens TaxID=580 RepID=UPI002DBF5DC5|nr:hypothetical protein [Kluyvera cryocrescens]MEB7557830.1 hypothetical protein [Kluyvera cryocrescens]